MGRGERWLGRKVVGSKACWRRARATRCEITVPALVPEFPILTAGRKGCEHFFYSLRGCADVSFKFCANGDDSAPPGGGEVETKLSKFDIRRVRERFEGSRIGLANWNERKVLETESSRKIGLKKRIIYNIERMDVSDFDPVKKEGWTCENCSLKLFSDVTRFQTISRAILFN